MVEIDRSSNSASLSRRHLTYSAGPFVPGLLLLALLLQVSAAAGQGPRDYSAIGLQEAFRRVAKDVKPAVVNVSAVRVYRVQEFGPGMAPFFEADPFFREFFGHPMFRPFFRRRGEEREFRQAGLGSGFIFDPKGYILTNRHVIKDADEIEVTVSVGATGKKYKARRIYADKETDVAVIKIDGGSFPFVRLGNSSGLQVGDWVLAIGNPFGLTQTITAGIVSAKGRAGMDILPHEEFIQTDAAINPGNSGGPLVNIDGEVVGMNTAILSRSGGYMGIGFAIPIDLIKRVVNIDRVRRSDLPGPRGRRSEPPGLRRQAPLLLPGRPPAGFPGNGQEEQGI